MIAEIRPCDIATCPICREPRHRVEDGNPDAYRIVLCCDQGHKAVVSWDAS